MYLEHILIVFKLRANIPTWIFSGVVAYRRESSRGLTSPYSPVEQPCYCTHASLQAKLGPPIITMNPLIIAIVPPNLQFLELRLVRIPERLEVWRRFLDAPPRAIQGIPPTLQ